MSVFLFRVSVFCPAAYDMGCTNVLWAAVRSLFRSNVSLLRLISAEISRLICVVGRLVYLSPSCKVNPAIRVAAAY